MDEIKQETPEITPQEAPTNPVSDVAEQNFRQLRHFAQEQANRNQILEQEIAALKQRIQTHGVEPDDDLDSDEIVEKKHLKKYIKPLQEQARKAHEENERIKKDMEHLQNVASEEILKNRYKGFSEIVNDTTLTNLSKEDPVLFNSIRAHPTLLERGEAAYKILKSHLSEKNKYTQQELKIEQNSNQPKAAAAAPPGGDATSSSIFNYAPGDRWIIEPRGKT